MGRNTLSGPASGGLLIYPLLQKRAGQAGARDEDSVRMMTASRLVAISYGQSVGTQGTAIHTTATDTQLHLTILGGSRVVHNKGRGVTATDLPFISGGTVEAARTIARAAHSAQGGATSAVDLSCAGGSTVVFGYNAFVIVAARGHRYDPDSPSNPYVCAKD